MMNHLALPGFISGNGTQVARLGLLLAALLLTGLPLSLAQAQVKVSGNYPGYVSLGPNLIVNLASNGSAKFVRLEIDFYVLSARDNDVIDQHRIALRDRLITLIGGRDMDELQSAEGRENLRKETLEALRETLTRFAGAPAIQDLYFTSFIMQ